MTTDRPGYITGLRVLADLLEQNPQVPLPWNGQHPKYSRISIHHLGAGQRDAFLATVRAFPGTKVKAPREQYFDVEVDLGGLYLEVTADRDEVCQRVVTVTREVTREVIVPVETRTETVTETVEDVEWICAPLLAPAATA